MASFDFKNDKIFFNYDFNEELDPNYVKFISKFTSLYFSDYNNMTLSFETDNQHKLTSDPTYMFSYVGSKFNKPVDGKLLDGLDKIHFGCCFNQTVDKLPCTITELILGQNFNNQINNLPPKLFKLQIGKYFNYPIDNLPINLKILNFDNESKFTHLLDNLPNGLKILKIGYEYNLELDNLPNSLIALEINGKFNKSLNNLPNSIEILHIDSVIKSKINKLPGNLEFIYFGLTFNNQDQISFPSNLKIIQFNPYCNYDKPIKTLPKNLEKIYFPKYYSKVFSQKSDKIIYIELDKKYKYLDKIKKKYSDTIIHFIE